MVLANHSSFHFKKKGVKYKVEGGGERGPFFNRRNIRTIDIMKI